MKWKDYWLKFRTVVSGKTMSILRQYNRSCRNSRYSLFKHCLLPFQYKLVKIMIDSSKFSFYAEIGMENIFYSSFGIQKATSSCFCWEMLNIIRITNKHVSILFSNCISLFNLPIKRRAYFLVYLFCWNQRFQCNGIQLCKYQRILRRATAFLNSINQIFGKYNQYQVLFLFIAVIPLQCIFLSNISFGKTDFQTQQRIQESIMYHRVIARSWLIRTTP